MCKKSKNLSTYSPVNFLTSVKRGFTLAEVLITLGIIGVVAAVTIPALVNNYNSKVWSSAATVFEQKLYSAIKVMNTQGKLKGYNTTEEFVEELSNNFKIAKTCAKDELVDCFSDIVYWGVGDVEPTAIEISGIKTAKNFGQMDWGTDIVGVQFANGVNALIAYNPTDTCEQDPYTNQINGESCFAILYDTTARKEPNTIGKDLRSNSGVTKLGNGCAFVVDGTCYATLPFIPEAHTWQGCTASGSTTNEDDLAFISKYGIRSCFRSDLGKIDYWAGAVKACGGVSKMPTGEQLGKLADYLYNTESTGTGDKSDVSLNVDRLLSLGFSMNTSSSFYIWSNNEMSNRRTWVRIFGPNSTKWESHNRNTNGWLAICLGDF